MAVRAFIAFQAVVAAIILYLAFSGDDGSLAVFAIPVVMLLAASIAFKPQLDWAYYKRFPTDVDPLVREIFASQLPAWYQSMSAEASLAFRQNTSLVHRGIAFRGKGFEDDAVPEDIGLIIATQLARIIPAGKHVLGEFENVVMYKHAFPSPQHPDTWHHSEIYTEDAVLIFDMEAALPGIFLPEQHFNVVLYEWIRAANFVQITSPAIGNSFAARSPVMPPQRALALKGIGLSEDYIDWEVVAQVFAMEAAPVTVELR